MDRAFLEGSDLVRKFGGVRAVDGMSLALAPGEMVGLIGPNGAGKTTLFNLLAGSLKPTSGRILVAGADVSREGPEHRIARGVGRTFQIPRPFAEMTVLENVLTGAQRQAGERAWMNFLAPGRVAAEERAAVARARELLDFVMLSRLETRARPRPLRRAAQAPRTRPRADGRPEGHPSRRAGGRREPRRSSSSSSTASAPCTPRGGRSC